MTETFALVLCLMMGDRFEEVRMPGLSRPECHQRLMSIQADQHNRGLAKGQCIGKYSRPMDAPRIYECATDACGRPLPGLLPGHRRV
jgi:hypothetical protein